MTTLISVDNVSCATASSSGKTDVVSAMIFQMDNTVVNTTGSAIVQYLTSNSILFRNESYTMNSTRSEATDFPEVKHSIYIILLHCLSYAVIFLLAFIGNIIVIAVIFRYKHMYNRSVTNFFIANLAVADLLVSIFCIPITLLTNIFTGMYNPYRRLILYEVLWFITWFALS